MRFCFILHFSMRFLDLCVKLLKKRQSLENVKKTVISELLTKLMKQNRGNAKLYKCFICPPKLHFNYGFQ